MLKQNIANYILYNLSKTDIERGLNVNSGLISEVVEGWNKNIYITPNQQIKINKSIAHKRILM